MTNGPAFIIQGQRAVINNNKSVNSVSRHVLT